MAHLDDGVGQAESLTDIVAHALGALAGEVVVEAIVTLGRGIAVEGDAAHDQRGVEDDRTDIVLDALQLAGVAMVVLVDGCLADGEVDVCLVAPADHGVMGIDELALADTPVADGGHQGVGGGDRGLAAVCLDTQQLELGVKHPVGVRQRAGVGIVGPGVSGTQLQDGRRGRMVSVGVAAVVLIGPWLHEGDGGIVGLMAQRVDEPGHVDGGQPLVAGDTL